MSILDSSVVRAHVSKSHLRTMLTEDILKSTENDDNLHFDSFEYFCKPSQTFAEGSICNSATSSQGIRILILDSAGKAVFDSTNFQQTLSVYVFDGYDNLLYSANRSPVEVVIPAETVKSHQKRRASTRKKVLVSSKRNCDLNEVSMFLHPSEQKQPQRKSQKSHNKQTVAIQENLQNIENSIIEQNVRGSINSFKDASMSDLLDNSSITDRSVTTVERFKSNLKAQKKNKDLMALETMDKRCKNGTVLSEFVSCNVCGVRYKTQIMLDKHQIAHKLEHTNTENPLQCAVCKKVYPTWKSLIVHKRKHGAAKNSVCGKCGKCFRTKQELVRHEYVHSSYKSSPCHICGKLFKNKAYAQMHSKLHSAENRKHVCKLCGKNFLRGSDIQKHMRVHTGERPFICSQCGHSFSESSHLIRHERLHTGEKPYQCDKCDQRFTHKEGLTRHSFSHMNHLPFSCEVCNKGFKSKPELDNHWLVHDKPTNPSLKETCKFCGKVFNHLMYLRCHMRTHTNLGSFKCPTCSKVFKKQSYLKQHVISQHSTAIFPELPVEQSLETHLDPVNSAFITFGDGNLAGPKDSVKRESSETFAEL